MAVCFSENSPKVKVAGAASRACTKARAQPPHNATSAMVKKAVMREGLPRMDHPVISEY